MLLLAAALFRPIVASLRRLTIEFPPGCKSWESGELRYLLKSLRPIVFGLTNLADGGGRGYSIDFF